MRDLALTPRMSVELEFELGRQLESCRRVIARAVAESGAALDALARLRAASEDDPQLARRFFLPASPDEEVDALAGRVQDEFAALLELVCDGHSSALEEPARSTLADRVYALRLTSDALDELLCRWQPVDDEDRACRERIERARAELCSCRRRLVEANLRLVLWELGKTRHSGADVEDLIQEGNVALLRAAELYDPGRDVRFSSYAIWWIRARVRRALQQRHAPVRLPLHIQRSLRELKSRAQKLATSLQREPTLQELAEDANMSVESARKLLARGAALEFVSLQAPGSSESPAALENAIADPDNVPAIEALVERELSDWLRANVSSLSEREQTVLALRFGFDEQERELSLAEIAREFGLSRERIRQIESAALERLCSGPRRAELALRCDSSRAPALRSGSIRVEKQLRSLRSRARTKTESEPPRARESELPDSSD